MRAVGVAARRNSLFKLQARYVVERQDMELWALALAEENTFRRQFIDQVIDHSIVEQNSVWATDLALVALEVSAIISHLSYGIFYL